MERNPNLWQRTALALCVGTAALAAAPARAETFVVEFSNIASAGLKGAVDNTLLRYTLGAHALITGFSWTVDVTAYNPSWLSELSLEFTSSSGEGVLVNPAPDTHTPGDATAVATYDLVNTGLSFRLGQDGKLNLEFYDTYDDFVGAADGRWNSGALSFTYTPSVVPEPGTTVLLAAGLVSLAWLARRRRSAGAAA